MKRITIGHRGEHECTIDVDTLIGSRMLVQANSGGGKSWMLRRLAEQLAPRVPIILLDLEGEFATLREKHDVLLCGHGREVPTQVEIAGALALRLLEHHVSAVIDLYDLQLQQRRAYVRKFLESLMAAPKRLWSPLCVFVDEAHVLCPQDGDSEASEAVNSLMCQGRKRDFCGILATQRLSKLHKDAAAEANNVLIGRTTLDVDQKRAADVLGFSKSDWPKMRDVEPGQFWAFGPAFNHRAVEAIRAGEVETTHGRKARDARLPAPSTSMRGTIGELADLAAKAKTEVHDIDAAKAKIRDLERQVTAASKAKPAAVPAVDTWAKDAEIARLTKALACARESDIKTHERVAQILGKQAEWYRGMAEALRKETTAPTKTITCSLPAPKAEQRPVRVATVSGPGEDIPKGERSILTACAMYDDGLTRTELTIHTGYKRSTRDAYVQRLGERGFVEVRGDLIVATEQGIAALGSFEPLPTGEALMEWWKGRLPEGERKVLESVAAVFPNPMPRDQITEQTGYKRSTRDAYLQRLGGKRLVEAERDGVKASERLFDAA